MSVIVSVCVSKSIFSKFKTEKMIKHVVPSQVCML